MLYNYEAELDLYTQLADEVLAAISSAPGFSRTASLPRSFETGVQCTFSGCYNTATLGLVAGRTQLVLQPTPCVVGKTVANNY